MIFDGNIHSLGGSYGLDESLNRAVAVDSRSILEALDKVYGAQRILAETQDRRLALMPPEEAAAGEFLRAVGEGKLDEVRKALRVALVRGVLILRWALTPSACLWILYPCRNALYFAVSAWP